MTITFGSNLHKKSYFLIPAINVIINKASIGFKGDWQAHFNFLTFHCWVSIMTTHYKVVAKNRFGHMTVFATQKPGLFELVKLCVKAVLYYRWVNLQISKL